MRRTRDILRTAGAVLTVLHAISGEAAAAAIDVLWYSYADPASEYITGINTISSMAGGYTQGAGVDWNLSVFAPGDSAPDFGAFDVLVVHSGEAFRTNPPGGSLATPDFSGILGNRAVIEAARGSRTVISGSDADFHAIRGDTGNPGSPAPMTDAAWDGALGHVVNAINWAGSGSGLNVVSFYDGEFPGSFWWLDDESFLKDELDGYVAQALDNTPFLTAELAGLPINAGLTTQGLSDWNNSFHAEFSLDAPNYSATILDRAPVEGGFQGLAVTIVRDDAVLIAITAPTQTALFIMGIALAMITRRWTAVGGRLQSGS